MSPDSIPCLDEAVQLAWPFFLLGMFGLLGYLAWRDGLRAGELVRVLLGRRPYAFDIAVVLLLMVTLLVPVATLAWTVQTCDASVATNSDLQGN